MFQSFIYKQRTIVFHATGQVRHLQAVHHLLNAVVTFTQALLANQTRMYIHSRCVPIVYGYSVGVSVLVVVNVLCMYVCVSVCAALATVTRQHTVCPGYCKTFTACPRCRSLLQTRQPHHGRDHITFPLKTKRQSLGYIYT